MRPNAPKWLSEALALRFTGGPEIVSMSRARGKRPVTSRARVVRCSRIPNDCFRDRLNAL
ncbi:MAG: hypothetical protein D6E12_11010 [Desulfovibrio sp.]|nr:MAG: hypothetical protein D6E12_11010 [Desulfovibrio sp.]